MSDTDNPNSPKTTNNPVSSGPAMRRYTLTTSETGLGYGPDKLASIMDELLVILENRLLGSDDKDEISISGAEIKNALLPFKSWQDKELQSILLNGWEDISKASEEAYWAKMRTHPLERLMVRNFAHLLAPYGQKAKQDKTFSRRMIPTFSALLQQMMGPDLLEEYQQRAHNLIEQQKEQHGHNLDWINIYQMASAQAIINDILVYIAQYFIKIESRRQWMVDFFNQNMARDKKHDALSWHFTDVTFIQLVTALYTGLFSQLERDDKKEALIKRYGAGNIETLVIIQHALQEDSLNVQATSKK